MTRRSRIAAGCLLLTAASTAPRIGQALQISERSYPIPKTLTMVNATLPIWADASVVLTEDGKPNPAIWGDDTTRIREILEQPDDNPIYYNDKIIRYSGVPNPQPGCRNVGQGNVDTVEPPPRATLDDAVTHSEIALLGRVTARAYGFSDTGPGQLLQIQPIQAFGCPLSQPRYYFFEPFGRFRVGGVTICTTHYLYADPPDIGGEVFLFVDRPVDPAGVLLHVIDAGDVVPVNPDGSLRLPRQYAAGEQAAARRAGTPQTKSDLLAIIPGLRVKTTHD
jgi:hypothetical protein